LYTSTGQLAAIVPYSVSGATLQVTVDFQGQLSPPLTLALATAAPALFTADSSGTGQAAALNQDGSANRAANPARVGDLISLFATGAGQTSPAGIDGKLGSPPLPQPVLPVTVTIGDRAAQVQYAGGAPGLVAGLVQIDVKIPDGVPPGNTIPVRVDVGGSSSQNGVSIAVTGTP
jgi:uncharacterized protein (TIGR03437 family)